MSEVFHTTNNGSSYQIIPFTQLQGGVNSAVRFTNNANILYSINYASDMAVPVKSIDGGNTWNLLPGNPDPSEETYSVYPNYYNPNQLIISYYNQIYFSGNGGISFSLIHTASNSGAGCTVGGVFFDVSNIYIGSNDGLIVSSNSGTSFSVSIVTGLPASERIWSFAAAKQGGTTRFFCLTADVNDIYAGLTGSDYWGFAKGIYSLDYGSGNWVSKSSGIVFTLDYPMFLATAENDINNVYAAGGSTSGNPIVMKTTNAGTSWVNVFNTVNNQNIYTGWCGYQGDRSWSYAECAFGIACAPNNSSAVVFTDYGFIHKTNNGGAYWHQGYVSAADEHNYGTPTPVGSNYHSVGLENTTCWQVLWTDATHLFAGFSDIKGIKSNDAGATWNFNYTGHDQNSMYRIVKHTNGNLYAATSTVHDIYQSTRLQDNILDAANADGKIIYSVDNGSTWNILHDFSMPVFWIERDPNNLSRMYASVINHTQSLGGIYITNNLLSGNASTWTKLSDPPRTEGHPACIVVLNDGKMVCTYSGRRNSSGAFTASSGTFLYDPVLNSWSDVSHTGMYYWSKDIVVDPNDAAQNTWYVGVFSGWGGAPNGLGGLYKTTNRGTSWTKIYSLDRVTSITFRPGHPDEIYLTSEQNGLWNCTNINNTMPQFNMVTSYPFRQPERVFFNPYNTNEIWVTSFGNGLRTANISTSDTKEEEIIINTTIYPNPNTGLFKIKFTSALSGENILVEINTIEGVNMYSQKFAMTRNTLIINPENIILNKGIYLLRISGTKYSRTEKFFIK